MQKHKNKLVKTENEHLHLSGGFVIPAEVADGITLAVLQEHLGYLKEELRSHVVDSKRMHPEDYHDTVIKYIPAFETLVLYFGGEL